jgi:thiamine pyrophosphate-dependent acetolactate synthase large subunit-like protein
VHARHENAAIAMADGYARETGEVGVASVTCGPGVTQIPTSLVAARRAQTPLVVFAGDTPLAGGFHLQAFDQGPLLAACDTRHVVVSSVERVLEDVQLAFHIARSERRPVVLTVPYDLQEREYPWDLEYRSSRELAVPAQAIVPSPAAVAAAADVLVQAERPVVVAGRGAVRAGARAAIEELGSRTGALLATSLRAKGWFDGHQWDIGVCGAYSTDAARKLLASADCVIGIGARLGYYTTEAGYMFPDATLVHVDLVPIGYVDGQRVADVHVQGDARTAVEALSRELEQRGHAAPGFRTDAVADVLVGPHADTAIFELEPGTVDPRRAVDEIEACVPRDWLIAIGVGHYWLFAIPGLRDRPPDCYLMTYDFAAIGQGLPTALGAAAAGRRPTILIEGDGSLLMYIEELEVLARHDIPLLVFVMNDGAYGAEVHKMRSKGFVDDEALFGRSDLAAVAAAFGITAHVVEQDGQIPAIVEDFRRRPRPMVVDVRVSTTVVGSVYRRLHFGEAS